MKFRENKKYQLVKFLTLYISYFIIDLIGNVVLLKKTINNIY